MYSPVSAVVVAAGAAETAAASATAMPAVKNILGVVMLVRIDDDGRQKGQREGSYLYQMQVEVYTSNIHDAYAQRHFGLGYEVMDGQGLVYMHESSQGRGGEQRVVSWW